MDSEKRQWKETSLELLLAGYAQGEVAAFDEFYLRTRKLVFKFIKRQVSSHADADEVYQETYFRVHRYITTYDQSQSALAWLLTIARHSALDLRKKQRRYAIPVQRQIEMRQDPESSKDVVEFRDLLFKACAGLKHDEIRLLVDRVLLEESFDDIAINYDSSPQNVRQKFSRLLRRLRSKLPL